MSFDAKLLVKHLGRIGARELPADTAGPLFAAMLSGTIDPTLMAALWMGLRIKGETQSELTAFLAAAHAAFTPWPMPAGRTMPLAIPSYNGARQLPNLVPLLACLVARAGVPVLVHGVSSDPARTTTREVFEALDNPPCLTPEDAAARHAAGLPAFVDIATLAPPLARLLDWRWQIGVRSSVHTIVKMLNPFAGPARRLVSVTHPGYLERMRDYFAIDPHGVFLLRGAEGEAVAHPRRALHMEFLQAGRAPVITACAGTDLPAPAAGNATAQATATWIRAALAGTVPIPPAIAAQAAACAAQSCALPAAVARAKAA